MTLPGKGEARNGTLMGEKVRRWQGWRLGPGGPCGASGSRDSSARLWVPPTALRLFWQPPVGERERHKECEQQGEQGLGTMMGSALWILTPDGRRCSKPHLALRETPELSGCYMGYICILCSIPELRNHRTTESFTLEKISRIIESKS